MIGMNDDLLGALHHVMSEFKCGISELTCGDDGALILQPIPPNGAGLSENYVLSFVNELVNHLELSGLISKYQASLDVLHVNGSIYRIRIEDLSQI